MVLPSVLAAVALLAYQPAWHGGLLWDDVGHLTRPALQSWSGLYQIWFNVGATQQYYPVVHTAFWIQHWLWGDATLGYHLTNVLLHAASASLVWLALGRLGVPGAPLAALVFALHPVHVESVAWMSELKNTLSGFFFLAAALAYLTFDETRSRRAYGCALAAFVLALLSKSVTVTLPAGLLVLLWWRHGTLDWRRDVRPLLPFAAVAVPIGLVTVWFERELIGAGASAFDLSWVERGLVAGRAAVFYAWTLVWPANLTFHYPRWTIDAGAWWQYLYPAGALFALAGGWLVRAQTRAPLAAALFFLVTLSPALGFVNAYPFRYSFVADHFQYLASLGPIAGFAAGIVLGGRRVLRWPDGRIAALAALAAGALLFPLTWAQSHDYRDEETLWRATLSRHPDSWAARNNLATLLLNHPDGRLAEALVHARRAVELDPSDPASHYNLGAALELSGQHEAATAAYGESLSRIALSRGGVTDLQAARVHHRLGRTLASLGRAGEAVAQYRLALARVAEPGAILADLGAALAELDRPEEALEVFEHALALDPASADNLTNRGGARLRLGRLDEARADLMEALRLDPHHLDARYNLGLALVQLGRYEQAAGELRIALAADPTSVSARRLLAQCHLSLGRAGDAVPLLRDAVALVAAAGSSEPELLYDLGLALLAAGETTEGRKYIAEALRLDPGVAGR